MPELHGQRYLRSELSRRVGFRIIPGLGERVIYRELFPKGLTMLDAREFGEMGLAHVAARQEHRDYRRVPNFRSGRDEVRPDHQAYGGGPPTRTRT